VTVQQLLGTHPRPVGDLEPAARCIEACAECATACTICADADIAEPDVAQMLRCSRLCLDCADVCTATGRVVGRQTQRDVAVLRAMLEACKTACRVWRGGVRAACQPPRALWHLRRQLPPL
jgi:hypothetical protein